jgi:hypothetical protein
LSAGGDDDEVGAVVGPPPPPPVPKKKRRWKEGLMREKRWTEVVVLALVVALVSLVTLA